MEGDAGTEPLTDDSSDADAATVSSEAQKTPRADGEHNHHFASTPAAVASSRLQRAALVAGSLILAVASAALIGAGLLAWRGYREGLAAERSYARALAVAEECAAATQAPSIDAFAEAQQTIAACATGQFQAQAALNAPQLAMLYQAARVRVRISEMRSAVERRNPDNSLDVLLAFRTEIDNVEVKGKEVGYRLRLKMIEDDGEYKVAELDQVGG